MSDEMWDAAIDLAAGRGCDPDDPCWQNCIDDALEDLRGKP